MHCSNLAEVRKKVKRGETFASNGDGNVLVELDDGVSFSQN